MLSAYRHGLIPFPAPDEYHRTLNEVRYEDQVAAGLIGLIGADGNGTDPYTVAWWCPDPRPVIAAGNIMQGAHGGIDMPQGDITRARNHLAKYYKKMGETAPWERG